MSTKEEFTDDPTFDQKKNTDGVNMEAKTFAQRTARATARHPKKIIVASFAVAFILSLIGPIVAGGLEITTDTKGWRSRGTLVAKREMQAEVLNLNRFQLFRDTDGSHWQYLKSTVTEGWILATERGTAYADPKKTSRRIEENMDLSLSLSKYERHDDNPKDILHLKIRAIHFGTKISELFSSKITCMQYGRSSPMRMMPLFRLWTKTYCPKYAMRK